MSVGVHKIRRGLKSIVRVGILWIRVSLAFFKRYEKSTN